MSPDFEQTSSVRLTPKAHFAKGCLNTYFGCVVSGAPAYEEEKWKSIRLNPGSSSLSNTADFHVSCRTVRCKLPNVDPATGTRHPAEPDRSLRKHRSVDAGAPLLGCLGMQMCPLFDDAGDVPREDLRSWVEVGMDIDVLAEGEHLYIKQ